MSHKTTSLSTPQQHSDQAPKDVKYRWDRRQVSELYALVKPLPYNPTEWVTTRRCISLEQAPDGCWYLLTPAGNRFPATDAEVSLWLDLQEALSPPLQDGQEQVNLPTLED